LKNKIEGGADQGQDLREVLDRLAMEQTKIKEEEQQLDDELVKLKDIKKMREQEAKEYNEKLRQVKN
jgi:hypothetical protein